MKIIESLDSGTNNLEYNRGWVMAEQALRDGFPSNGPVPDIVATSEAFEGYTDRMLIFVEGARLEA
jgi:hypothetical protein